MKVSCRDAQAASLLPAECSTKIGEAVSPLASVVTALCHRLAMLMAGKVRLCVCVVQGRQWRSRPLQMLTFSPMDVVQAEDWILLTAPLAIQKLKFVAQEESQQSSPSIIVEDAVCHMDSIRRHMGHNGLAASRQALVFAKMSWFDLRL